MIPTEDMIAAGTVILEDFHDAVAPNLLAEMVYLAMVARHPDSKLDAVLREAKSAASKIERLNGRIDGMVIAIDHFATFKGDIQVSVFAITRIGLMTALEIHGEATRIFGPERVPPVAEIKRFAALMEPLLPPHMNGAPV